MKTKRPLRVLSLAALGLLTLAWNAGLATAQSAGVTGTDAAEPTYRYNQPFLQPLPVWDYWWALIIPLIVSVSIVYKCVKCSHIWEVPRAALGMTFWILFAFTATAVGLLGLVRVMQ